MEGNSPADHIPFNRPFIASEEMGAVEDVLASGVLRGEGDVGRRVQQVMQRWLDVEYVFLTTSCTHALEMATLVLDLGPGDEVIMPSFNFVSSANAVVLRGAQPVFADIKPNTLNIDPADVERKITSNTRAIVPVHYAGVGCEMEALATLADRHDLTIVEDAAQAVDAYYQGDPLGTIGDIGCFSFHETKNITCGEGGAFLTNSTEIAEKAELAREKGTNRSAFLRGEVDKYTWVSPGSSYVQSDILAAVLEVQLQRREVIKERRRRVWEGYHEALAPELEETGFRLPVIPKDRESNYHIFYVLAPNQDLRDRLLERLKSNGVDATFHYIPLHSSPFGQTITPDDVSLPVTTECSNRLIRLPVYPQLSHRIEEVAERVRSVFSEMV